MHVDTHTQEKTKSCIPLKHVRLKWFKFDFALTIILKSRKQYFFKILEIRVNIDNSCISEDHKEYMYLRSAVSA